MDVTYEQLQKALQMSAGKGGIYYGALANAQNSLQGKWSNFKESFVNGLANIGDNFRPLISLVLDFGTSISIGIQNISEFAKWMNSGTDGANAFLVVLGVIGGALATYGAIMGVLAVKAGIVTAAQWLWNIAVSANPIGIFVVAIGALIAGLIVAYKRFDDFRAMVDGVWASLKQIGSNIMGMFTKLPNMIITAFTQIPKAIANVFSGVGDLFSAIFSGDFSKIPGILKNLGGNLLKTNPITGFSSQVFTEATKGVGKAYSKAESKSLLDSKIAHQKEKEANELDKNKKVTTANAAAGASAGDTVSGAGPKVINIHVGKFFDNLQFTTLNTGESANEIEKIVMECFARVVYNGSKMI